MTEKMPQAKYRKDYQTPDFSVDTIDLKFELGEEFTVVTAKQVFRRNPDKAGAPLKLDGEDLKLLSVAIDGQKLAEGAYSLADEGMTIAEVPDSFELSTQVELKPQENTELSGLYKSSGNFCTQCEALGFRRITYSLDRPDVMSTYTVTIVGDAEKYPVMLSNGNRVDGGRREDGLTWVRWHDPHKKPSYLFALVAGSLKAHSGEFVTRSGRKVQLEIWVEPQNIDKCEHALVSLQKSMKWDEEVFGLEYDLDIYMIVAVGDFNMGAMENKGLNIFNSKYVLAKPETATDEDYEGIEGVIAHEYFHNWTGNRVTCRDWFQLTLKEGLTVFRDQQFSADMTSAAVKRISEVRILRTAQFDEDAGPMAHPIRPESYIAMDNFYTATVYVKGAEVIRMYHTLLGQEGFRKGMDLYFERHDGQAVTCDDFRAAMADANGINLAQFERWYQQAGTPEVHAQGKYDPTAKTYTLTLRQSRHDLKGHAPYQAMHIPVRMGLLGPDGKDVPLKLSGTNQGPASELVLELKEMEQDFVFEGIEKKVVPSLLRDLSAPVRLRMERSREELAFLWAHDSDDFNRWDAGQTLGLSVILDLVKCAQNQDDLVLPEAFLGAFRNLLLDDRLDGSLKAMAMALPAERVIAQEMDVVDPDAVHAAREFVKSSLAAVHERLLVDIYQANADNGPYQNDKQSIARRRLKNASINYLSTLGGKYLDQAHTQLQNATNMTDSHAALATLVDTACPQRDQALQAFYDKYRDDPLVMDKWFSVQAMACSKDALERCLALAEHADFTLSNPNRARSLIGAFMNNAPVFHDKQGRGYRFLADQVVALQAKNPQLAARLVSGFNHWKRYDTQRQDLMKAELERIIAEPNLSKDVYEIVARALGRNDTAA